MIKDSKIDELLASLNGLRISHLLACHQAEFSIKRESPADQTKDLANLNEAFKTTKREEIDAFSSKIIHGQIKTMLLDNNMHVMVQTLRGGDGLCFPHSLSIMNTYTELTTRSKWVAVVVKNLTATPITLTKGIKVTQVVAVNVVPLAEVVPGTLEQLYEIQGIQWTSMSVEQRKKVFFQQLELSGLEGWSGKDQAATHALLVEYHYIFSLEPGELGCTNLVKHEIKVADDEPFKERLQGIPPPMVDEVLTHVKEMLEVGVIHPSQSPWCNTIMLVCKKDGDLQFCINFYKLNVRTKKDSYPLPQIQEAIKSSVGAGHFPCLDLKAGFWQIAMDKALKQYTVFTVGNLGFFEHKCMPFGLCNTLAMFQRLMQNCLGELNMTYCLIYLDDVIIFSKTEEEHLHLLLIVFECFREHHLKLKLTKCEFFKSETNYLAHHVSKEGVWPVERIWRPWQNSLHPELTQKS